MMFGLSQKITGIIGGAMAFAMIGLLVALMITRGTLEKRTAERDAAVAQAQAEQAKHAVTRSSLDQALAIIDAKNAESEARAKAFSDAKERAAALDAKNDKLEATTDAQRAALEAIAKVPGGSVHCKVPDALTRNLEGL